MIILQDQVISANIKFVQEVQMKIKRNRRFLKKVIRYTDQNRFDIIGKNYIFAGQVISNQLQIKYLFPSIQNILEKNNDKPEIITNAIQFYYSPTNFNICQVPYKNHATGLSIV